MAERVNRFSIRLSQGERPVSLQGQIAREGDGYRLQLPFEDAIILFPALSGLPAATGKQARLFGFLSREEARFEVFRLSVLSPPPALP